MEAILSFAIRDARGLSASQKSILFALASRCAPGKNKAWPGLDTLAADAGLSDRGAQKVVAQLERLGWLKVKRTKRKGHRDATNEYTITPCEGEPHSPRGELRSPTQGESRSPEVENISEEEKETTKSSLTTRGRRREQNQHPATLLVRWLRSIGAKAIDVASLSREERGERRTTFKLIEPTLAQSENAAHSCIFIRPARGDAQPAIMLDDLNAMSANDVARHWRSAIVETSAGNHQVWIATTRLMTEDERKRVQRIVGAGCGADKGSVSGEHWGRCPGFINRKPERNGFLSKLIHIAEHGKLLDVDAVLRQEPVTPALRYRHPAYALPSFKRRSVTRINVGGDASESGREWGWVMGALEHGISPVEIETRLAYQSEARRGKDTARYASRTVRAALKKVGART